MTRNPWILAPILAVGACLSQPTGPSGTLQGLPDGLTIDFRLDPDEVSPHGSFSAILEISNTRWDTLRVVTGNGCLAIPRVMRDGEVIPLRGSAWGCTAAVTTHVFPPQETRSLVWEMQAELYAVGADDTDGAPAPAGEYVVQAEFDVSPVDGPGRKPVVEDTLLVMTDDTGPS